MPLDQNNLLEQLISALNISDSPSTFCKNLVHGLLIQDQAFAANILYLADNSRVNVLGAYGYSPEQASKLETSVWSDSPVATSIRTKKSAGFTSIDAEGLGAVSHHLLFPLVESLVPVGCLSLEFAKPYEEASLNEPVQNAINLAGVAALNRFAPRKDSSNRPSMKSANGAETSQLVLSKRQLVVLAGMRDELSNAEIATQLHLSESSIKQETVRLFRALGVKNRAEARLIALDRLVIH